MTIVKECNEASNDMNVIWFNQTIRRELPYIMERDASYKWRLKFTLLNSILPPDDMKKINDYYKVHTGASTVYRHNNDYCNNYKGVMDIIMKNRDLIEFHQL